MSDRPTPMTSEAIEEIWKARERLKAKTASRIGLVNAAMCHAVTCNPNLNKTATVCYYWPFKRRFKPSKTELESLADAAAYLCAAIERILEEGGAQ